MEHQSQGTIPRSAFVKVRSLCPLSSWTQPDQQRRRKFASATGMAGTYSVAAPSRIRCQFQPCEMYARRSRWSSSVTIGQSIAARSESDSASCRATTTRDHTTLAPWREISQGLTARRLRAPCGLWLARTDGSLPRTLMVQGPRMTKPVN